MLIFKVNIPKLVLLQDPDNSTAIVGVIISAVILLLCGATTALSWWEERDGATEVLPLEVCARLNMGIMVARMVF